MHSCNSIRYCIDEVPAVYYLPYCRRPVAFCWWMAGLTAASAGPRLPSVALARVADSASRTDHVWIFKMPYTMVRYVDPAGPIGEGLEN